MPPGERSVGDVRGRRRPSAYRRSTPDGVRAACGERGPGAPDELHQPLRRVQTSSITDITAMPPSSSASGPGSVWSLTITFIPMIELIAVTGSVTAAITASRSAATVIFVPVRVR